MAELKTEETLLVALRRAATRKLSAAEVREQRVSYVMGILKADSDVTRERVRDVLAKQAGSQ